MSRRQHFGGRWRATRAAAVLFVALGVGFGAAVGQSRAAVTLTAVESGGDVVFTGGGTVNLAGLNYQNSPGTSIGVYPAFSRRRVFVGNTPNMSFNFDAYTFVSQPAAFGTGLFRQADVGSGDRFGIDRNTLYLPQGYAGGTPLSGTATYLDTTFATLGMTPGTYTWTWGSGGTADALTLNIVGGSPMVLGDYNDSGSVEQGDLDLVLNNWGGPRTVGFVANTDGFTTDNVDQEELDRVLNNWGSVASSNLRGFSVPEPASAVVLLAGVALTGLRRYPV